MKKINLILFSIFFMIVTSSIVNSAETTMAGNMTGKGVYGIYNLTSLFAVNVYQNGNKVLDNTTTISNANYSSFSNYSNYSGQASFWATVQGYESAYFYNTGNILTLNKTQLNSTIVANIPTNLSNFTNDLDFINSTFANNTYLNKSDAVLNYVNRSNWTTINNYPSACSSGQYVSEINDTLTCGTPVGTLYTAGLGLELNTTTFNINDTYIQQFNYSTKADSGYCAAGEFIQNATSSGIECTTPPQGTVTEINTGAGLTGGPINSNGTIDVNITYLSNSLIDINTTSVNATNFYGNLNYSYIQNVPSFVLQSSQVKTTGPLFVNNASSANIDSGFNLSITQANNVTGGYLSAVDWNTFNNKGNGNGTVTNIERGFGFNFSGTNITSSGNLTINTTEIQRRVGASCTTGIGLINEDGTVSCSAYQVNLTNSSNAIFGNVNTTGNITVNTNSYLMGQPLLGMMGSGLISSVSDTGTKTSSINVTCTGLNCSYNNFSMRIMQGNALNYATYCNIPNGSYVVTDNVFTTLYVDSNCTIQATTYDTWFTTTMQTGGKWDFAYVLAQNGAVEIFDAISLEQRRLMKLRTLNYYFQQSKVISGFNFQPNTTRYSFNITAGKTVFGMDVVDVNLHQTINATNHIEVVGHNGSASTWQFNDNIILNVTHCDNGTNVSTCTGNNYRRHFIFVIGFDDSVRTSELHQLYALEGTTYGSVATCIDTTTNPITYTIPDQYKGAAVMLYAYCARRTDTNFLAANIIDLRSVKTGLATGGTDISNLVPYTGAVSNLNMGSLNVTAGTFIGSIPYTNITGGPVACPANNFMTHNDFAAGTITCTSVQEALVNFTVDGNLSVLQNATIVGNLTASQFYGNINASYIQNALWSNLTSITAGTGLTGGVITTSGTIAVNDTYIQQFNDTAAIALKSNTGNCSAGEVVQNTTTSGVQCIAVGSAYTAGLGLELSGTTFSLNTTYTNATYLKLSGGTMTGNITTNSQIIHTVNGTVTTYANGCSQIANSTGIYFVC